MFSFTQLVIVDHTFVLTHALRDTLHGIPSPLLECGLESDRYCESLYLSSVAYYFAGIRTQFSLRVTTKAERI